MEIARRESTREYPPLLRSTTSLVLPRAYAPSHLILVLSIQVKRDDIPSDPGGAFHQVTRFNKPLPWIKVQTFNLCTLTEWIITCSGRANIDFADLARYIETG